MEAGDVDFGRCLCGRETLDPWFRREHDRWHLAWSAGVVLPRDVPAWRGLITVTGASPAPYRKLAYQLARLHQREAGYDFPSLPYPATWRQYEGIAAFIAAWQGRALGLAVTGTAMGYCWLDARGDAVPGAVPAIAGIFVCHAWRRRGIGRWLVEQVAAARGCLPRDLAWLGPLSDDGEALARSITGGDVRVCYHVPWTEQR